MDVTLNPVIAGAFNQFGEVILAQSGVASSVTGTTSETTLLSVYVPPALLGPNSRIEIRPTWSYTNSANNKTFAVKAGLTLGAATTIYSRTRTTSAGEMPLIAIQMRGSLTTQLTPYSPAGNYSINTTAASVITVDFSAGVFLFFSATLANTGETITLDAVQVKICGPGLR